MRVVHVLHSMAVAGAEVLVHDFVAARSEGIQQSILTLDSLGALGESLKSSGFDIECLGRRPGVDLSLPLRLARAVAKRRADVVHAHQYTPYFYSAVATRTMRDRPALIFTEHGRHIPDFRRPKRVVFNQLALTWTSRVTAVCSYVKRLLVTNEGIGPERIDVIYNGVDPTRFTGTVDTAAVRGELGIASDDLVVACVARFHPIKDHPTLIKGFAHAAAHIPKARLLLVGGGPGEASLRELTATLGLDGRVTFAGVRKDIPQILAASDLFAMTSISEGTSVTLLEAMLARRAAVVTDVGGNPEIVDAGGTGLLVRKGNIEQTGEALAALLGDRARRESFGAAGRERVLRTFTQGRMHQAWRNVYADSVRELRPGAAA